MISFISDENDIRAFVTLALATAAGGEGALADDKLSHLLTVGTGYKSLIYELKNTDGCQQLMDKCNSLWNALEENKDLPDLLVSYLSEASIKILLICKSDSITHCFFYFSQHKN